MIGSTARIPRGLLGMLALMAVVEATIAIRHLDFTTVWADDWRLTARAAREKAPGRDVLVFGDSLVKYGVLPKVIEARSGLRSYNLAINAGTMPSAYFLLRRAMGSGAKPKAIVADFFALMLADQPMLSIRTYPDLATPGDCLDLAWTARDPSLFASTMLGKALPSYKCRHEIRASVKAALEGRRASPWPQQSAIWATWKAQDGAQPMPSMAIKPPIDPSIVVSLAPKEWSCDRLNAVYFEKFLTLAAEHQLPVYWLMPPLSPEVHGYRALLGTDEAYTRLARSTQERYPRLQILDARHSGYDGSVHIDAIHLDQHGARVLSADLAEVLADRLRSPSSNPRWLDLPPYAGRSGDEPRAGLARARSSTDPH